jgi:UDP-N-acetylglucosamine:LPS N-acetylglucosamine transferase
MSVRVLVVTAAIGAGHDVSAGAVARGVRRLRPDASVEVLDGLAVAGRAVRAALGGTGSLTHDRFPALFDAQYRLLVGSPTGGRISAWVAGAAVGSRLLAAVERARPDVVVSTYPGSTAVLARLRACGRLRPPLVSTITDLAALRFWADPACDLHLLTHAEAREEVLAIAGRGARIDHVRGLTDERFEAPPSREEARRALGLEDDAPVVVVSGGGWGVGDLGTAVEVVLRASPRAVAVVLCGHNASARERLRARFGAERRCRLLGFTDRMPELLAAADVLVHATGGLTVLEAQICGTHAISFGWGVGHVRINNLAYRRTGLAAVAGDRRELERAVRRGLSAPRPRDERYATLPAAAERVLAVAAQ